MKSKETRALIVDIIADIAPEIDLTDTTGDEHLQETFGLDSMDFLSILEEIAAKTGVDIPESDYEEVVTLQGMTQYVAKRAP